MKKTLLIAIAATFICARAHAAPVEIPASPIVPAGKPDPIAPARAALAFAADGEKCRFAFSRKAVTDARATWASASAASVVRFDPRLPIGSRYKISGAADPALSKALAKQDTLGKPDDLTALLPEGAYKITSLAPAKGGPDSETFSFAPDVIASRAPNKDAVKMLASETGTMALDRESWRITSVTLRVPAKGVRLGMTKIRSGSTALTYSVLRDRFVLAERRIEARDTGRGATTTGVVYGDIEPICDPGEVARVGKAEAAAPRKK